MWKWKMVSVEGRLKKTGFRNEFFMQRKKNRKYPNRQKWNERLSMREILPVEVIIMFLTP